MRLRLITPPADDVVAVADARAQVELGTSTAHDTQLTGMVGAAVAHLDGKAGILGRALVNQTWELSLDDFPRHRFGGDFRPLTRQHLESISALVIPLPPLVSVSSVTYIAPDGTLTTLDPSAYDVDLASEPGVITPAYGTTWPTTRAVRNAVKVTFVAGYGAAGIDVPQAIRSAILLMVGDLFENREGVTGDARAAYVDNPTVDRLLAPYRMLTL